MRIQNARWIQNDGLEVAGEIDVSNGFLSLYPSTQAAPPLAPGEASLDATGLLVFPGLVDPHVHFREPGAVHKEGIDSGTRCALAGGVTTVLEMPNTVPVTSTPEALAEKSALYTQKSLTHWGLHYQATSGGQTFPDAPIASAKIYMAKSSIDGAVVDEDALVRTFVTFPRVAVHAEDETKFCAGALPGPLDRADRMHHIVRPKAAILSALAKLERALKRVKKPPRLVLCHAGTLEEVMWVGRMKHEGFDVWAETCPHYFLLTQDDYVRVGADLKVNPPLRTMADRDAVLEGLASGVIDFVATDHAPHTPEEKASESAPSGIASIECLLPLMAGLAEANRLSRARLLRTCVLAASSCYGLPHRTGIQSGGIADLVFVRKGPHPAGPVLTKARTHPYVQTTFDYEVVMTMVGGVVKYDRGAYPDEAPLPCVYEVS